MMKINYFQIFSSIIEKRKFSVVTTANSQLILMFLDIGHYINLTILKDDRTEYGKKKLPTVSTKLVNQYGKSFVEAYLYLMKRFATVFSDVSLIPFMLIN